MFDTIRSFEINRACSVLFDRPVLEKGPPLIPPVSEVKAAFRKKAKQYHPDLIMLNLMMPIINGIDVCREISSKALTPSPTRTRASARSRSAAPGSGTPGAAPISGLQFGRCAGAPCG